MDAIQRWQYQVKAEPVTVPAEEPAEPDFGWYAAFVEPEFPPIRILVGGESRVDLVELAYGWYRPLEEPVLPVPPNPPGGEVRVDVVELSFDWYVPPPVEAPGPRTFNPVWSGGETRVDLVELSFDWWVQYPEQILVPIYAFYATKGGEFRVEVVPLPYDWWVDWQTPPPGPPVLPAAILGQYRLLLGYDSPAADVPPGTRPPVFEDITGIRTMGLRFVNLGPGRVPPRIPHRQRPRRRER